jgi:regulator of protease activity HflC (stomatin/prohibitin superfamily)
MISILISVAVLVIALGYAIANRKNIYDSDGDFVLSGLKTPIAILVVGLLIAFIQPYCLKRIDSGNIGIKVNLIGDKRGVSDYTYKNGWTAYNEWSESLYEFPTFQQHTEYQNQSVITKGGFQADIKPTFNYSIKPEAVGDMFMNLRVPIKQVEQGWMMNAICGSINDVANKWTVDDIFNEREKFEAAITAECNKRVAKWFLVSQLRTNIMPPEALKNAIIEKTKAIQEAQGQVQKAIVADAKAKVKMATARGDSAQAVIGASGKALAAEITAKGEAAAMKLKQMQLTPMYIDYIRANNWDGKYPATMLGGNSQTLLNLK